MRTRNPPKAVAISATGETRAAQDSETAASRKFVATTAIARSADQAPLDPPSNAATSTTTGAAGTARFTMSVASSVSTFGTSAVVAGAVIVRRRGRVVR